MSERLSHVRPANEKAFGRALLLYLAVLFLLFLLFADVLFLGRTLEPYPLVAGVSGVSPSWVSS